MSLPVEFTTYNDNSSKTSLAGKILLGVTGSVALGLSVISASFVSPAFRKFCLPYIPATRTQISNILQALEGRRGTLLDLGSGDGRIVLEAAKRNLVAHGVELNIWLVLYSKLDALRKGLANKTSFYRRDLWKFHVGKYDNIVIFGVEQMMGDLEVKFDSQCKNGCNVVACRFPLPNKRPTRTIGHGIDTVWIYEFNSPRRKSLDL
ncbi:hypothetical protein GEV33_009763 [Tenebrio molitor]|uniref:Protein FAM173B n=1 Tax=Tenebrio molitor TaxID=7067 RepID=A0A8J6H6V6_TENMO|nr:hypothetical protein GEV33_009763 [Tenebrio molitor]